MLRQKQYLTLHSSHDLGLVLLKAERKEDRLHHEEGFLFPSLFTHRFPVLKHVLNDVISVLVLQQLRRALVQLVQYGQHLFGSAVLQDALDHAATVRVRGQAIHLTLERTDDELEIGRLHALDALLDDVIAVLILDALEDVALEFGDDQLLLIEGDALQGLLDHTTAVHLQGQRLHMRSQLKEK